MRSRSASLILASSILASFLSACLLIPATPASAGPPEDPAPRTTIDLEPAGERDAAIARRLESIYAELEELDEVAVAVEAGVVRLSGSVFELEAADEAEAIARRVEGVVTVDNDIEQVTSLARRVRPLLDRLRERGVEFLMFAPLLLVGIVIVLTAWLLARLFGRLVQRRARKKRAGNLFVRELAGQIVRAAMVIAGVVIALELMGATTLIGAVLGTAGIVGLALGFALKDMGENYIASILLSIRQPFEPNDLVEIDGHSGRVIRLTSRATVLLNLDGNHIRIPNSAVFKGTIINYTRNPERRVYFELGVSVDADLTRVQELAIATIAATPGILAKPPPTCLVQAFGDSAMIIEVAGWIDQRNADWFKVGSEARRRIKVAFECADIEVPEPIYRVLTSDLDRAAERKTSGESLETPAKADVSPDEHLVAQVEEERASLGADDLLRPEAPIE